MRYRLWAFILLCASLLHAATLNAPAPTFALMNSRRQNRTLPDYRGKIVFINFWASWCGPCQAELPQLNRLAADYNGKKVRVLAINVDSNRADAKKLLGTLGLAGSNLEILWDTKSKVVSTYNVESMPSSFIVDPKGIVRFTHVGFHSQDPQIWRQEIEQLVNARDR
jgi:cytochrome c biogenesis protein CcmG, thiol:disulfide interchange protein DsbE